MSYADECLTFTSGSQSTTDASVITAVTVGSITQPTFSAETKVESISLHTNVSVNSASFSGTSTDVSTSGYLPKLGAGFTGSTLLLRAHLNQRVR